ncbi:MAG: BatA domain-containing protein [Candidatus Altiarchaeota archaeon]
MPLPIPSGFINPVALAAALLIVPLIVLYLLKPKPKRIKFPTVMFIKRIEETKRFSSLLNKFIKDLLLLIQIAMILILVLAMADPYALVEKTKAKDEAIAVVIDSSASMQATDVSPTRFFAAVDKAREIVSKASDNSKVTLILAENIPVTIVSNENPKKALSILDKLSCSDTTSNIGDALILAKDLLMENTMKKTAYVISDFAKESGDAATSMRVLKMNGINVYSTKVNDEGANAGIIDIEARRAPMSKNIIYLTYTVRNYEDTEQEITGKVYVDNVLASIETKNIKPMSEELFYMNMSVSNEKHTLTIELAGGGTLEVDDRGYAVIPALENYRTMLLTSENKDRYLSYAIEAQLNNVLRTVEPPVIPPLDEFDTIIVGSIKGDSILPGTFRDIKNYAESGKSVIIMASQDLRLIEDPNFHAMMPVTLEDRVSLERSPQAINHEILNDVSLENTIIKSYYNAKKKENATVIAEIEGNPLIAYWTLGKGRVAYVGINPSKDWSNMHYSSSFPIFWSQLIEYVNKREEAVRSLDFKTGEYLVLENEVEITNPTGAKTNSRSVFLDKEGFYTIKSKGKEVVIAVNLMNEDESNIKTALQNLGEAKAEESGAETSTEELFRHMLLIAAFILFIEMVVYRMRGLL